MSHWSEKKEAGSLLGLRILFVTYRFCGRGLFRLFLVPVMLYFFLLRGAARRASFDFLARASANARPAGWTKWRQSFSHFMTYGDLLLDKLAIWFGCLDADYAIHGFEPLDALIAKGEGAVLLVGHMGNVDISMALAERWETAKVNALVHTAHAEKFNRMVNEVSGKRAINLIQVTDISPATAMMLAGRLSTGELLAIAGDRTAVGESARAERRLTAKFLGQDAEFPLGPYLLAALLRRPVFFLCSVKAGNRYDIYLEPVAERVVMKRGNREASLLPYVQIYADKLGAFARRFPLQWGNFYDFWRTGAQQSSNNDDTEAKHP